jgi:hypothetical protein
MFRVMQPDEEHREVIAAYAAGEDVAEIERRHGLTRDEIEWLVRHDAGHRPSGPNTPSMPNTPSTPDRPPAAIVVAVVIVAVGAAAVLATAGILVAALGFHIGILPVLVFGGLGVGICVSTARGLGQRRRGARVTTIVIGVALMVSGGGATSGSQTALPTIVWIAGVVLIVLVAVPRSSREWFRSGSGDGAEPARRWRL